MDNLLRVVLAAEHFELNHHRRYEITISYDLLDHWMVSVRYGRIGQWGREERFASRDADQIRAVIRERLQMRLSAPRRIGCPYRLVSLTAGPGYDPAAWLPNDLIDRFGDTHYEKRLDITS